MNMTNNTTPATETVGFDADTIAPTESLADKMAAKPSSPGADLLAKYGFGD